MSANHAAFAQPTEGHGYAVAGQRALAGPILRHIALAIVLAFFLMPVLYLGSTSLKAKDDVLSGAFLPRELMTQNWPDAYDRIDVFLFLRNSAVAASLSAIVTLVLAVPATYAMVRHRTGGKALYSFVLSSYVAPPVVALLPLFYLLKDLGLIDSLLGLGFVYGLMNLPVAVWLLDSFVRQVPREIEEASWIDGNGIFGGMVRMVVPLIAPGIVAAGIICLILAYNEFLFALVFTFRPETQTLPIGIALFQGDRLVNFGQMAAASFTGIVPVYIVALFCQRWLIKGLTHGAVK
ncbi:MAG: carbohydrate ABC transporter permease [Thermomicrobiales bacterium]|nr:carbohydrate ABC transporter permease [Thermomicrobiales bacterium]